MESQVVRDGAEAAVGVDQEPVEEQVADEVLRRIDIRGEQGGELAAVLRTVAPRGRVVEGDQEAGKRLRVRRGPIGAHAEHLLRRRRPDVGLDRDHPADAARDREHVPGGIDEKPSMAPLASASAVKGGGTTVMVTSWSGLIPPALSQ